MLRTSKILLLAVLTIGLTANFAAAQYPRTYPPSYPPTTYPPRVYPPPVYPPMVYPPTVYPPTTWPPIVVPNATGGTTFINPERLWNPASGIPIAGTQGSVSSFNPYTGQWTTGQTWIGWDGRPHGNLTTHNPDGTVHQNIYGARPGSTGQVTPRPQVYPPRYR